MDTIIDMIDRQCSGGNWDEPHYVYCAECGCRINADEVETADDLEYYCKECDLKETEL